jgi:hypothetical protein
MLVRTKESRREEMSRIPPVPPNLLTHGICIVGSKDGSAGGAEVPFCLSSLSCVFITTNKKRLATLFQRRVCKSYNDEGRNTDKSQN